MSTATRIGNLQMDTGADRTQARAPTDVAAWFDEALPRIFDYFLPRVARVGFADDRLVVTTRDSVDAPIDAIHVNRIRK